MTMTTRGYYTFREKVARESWVFSHVRKEASVYRRALFSAIPYTFNPDVTQQIYEEFYKLTNPDAKMTPDSRVNNAFNYRMPEYYGEAEHWHMPAGLVWAETGLFEGSDKRIGMLYIASRRDPTQTPPPGDDTYTKKGMCLIFIENAANDTPLGVMAVRFMLGRSVINSEVRGKLPDNAASIWAAGIAALDFNSIHDFEQVLIGQNTPSTETIASMFQLGISFVFPFLRVFNAVPVRSRVRVKRYGYEAIETFAGTGFPIQGDKHVKIDLGLQRSIVLEMDDTDRVSVATGERKCLYFRRGYWRTRKNGVLLPRDKWVFVEARWQGDPSLGISNRSYEYIDSLK